MRTIIVGRTTRTFTFHHAPSRGVHNAVCRCWQLWEPQRRVYPVAGAQFYSGARRTDGGFLQLVYAESVTGGA
jgi:hypothetical protein